MLVTTVFGIDVARGSIIRRHIATKSTAVDTINNQFSGYGSRPSMLRKVFDKLDLNSEEARIEHWSQEQVEKMVQVFVQTRFPTVLSLNKVDHPGMAPQRRSGRRSD